MARALLVGCGCRGRELGVELLAAGWQVRGTTRHPENVAAIERAGIDPVVANPERVGTVLEWIEDVAVVAWLLGSARAEPEVVAAIHGARLERLLEELVDTPVRGFVYECAGSVMRNHLDGGRRIALAASERWRIPVEMLDEDPSDPTAWTDAAVESCRRLIGA